MKKEIIIHLHKNFEGAAYEEEGLEYWLARELQQLLGYTDWRNFVGVINRAKESCKNAEIEPNYHFVDVNKMIKLPKNAVREVEDIMLTRYAC